MRRITYIDTWVTSHLEMRHVTHMNATLHTYECDTSHVYTSIHAVWIDSNRECMHTHTHAHTNAHLHAHTHTGVHNRTIHAYTHTLCAYITGTANPTWGDIFEWCFKAQSSKLESLFSLKRGKRDVRTLSFELSKMSPQLGLAVVSCFLIPIRISFCIPMTIPSLIFHGTGCTARSLEDETRNEGRSKPELENLEPRTQDLARFWNCDVFQAEPRKMMWRCDEIVTFVPSSRKIVTFLEVLKKNFF